MSRLCLLRKEAELWAAMPVEKWNGLDAISTWQGNEHLFDEDDIRDWVNDLVDEAIVEHPGKDIDDIRDTVLWNAQLVKCVIATRRRFDFVDYFYDNLADNQRDDRDDYEQANEQINQIIDSVFPDVWEPVKIRIDVKNLKEILWPQEK